MIVSRHLTQPQGAEWAARIAATASGMASWATSGPAGATCRQCSFWAGIKRGDVWGAVKRFARERNDELQPRRCQKYSQMMQGVRGGRVPHDTSACSQFAQAETVPPVRPVPKPKKVKGAAGKSASAKKARRAR